MPITNFCFLRITKYSVLANKKIINQLIVLKNYVINTFYKKAGLPKNYYFLWIF